MTHYLFSSFAWSGGGFMLGLGVGYVLGKVQTRPRENR